MDLQQSLGQAMALLSAGRLGEAEQLCLSLLNASPRAHQVQHVLGQIRLRQGRAAEALASFDNALMLAPASAPLLAARAGALQGLGRSEEALAGYDAALRLRPDLVAAWFNRAVLLRRLKRPQEALQCYEQVLARDPGHLGALNNRGNTLRDLERYEEALASFDAALALKPGDTDMLFNRGVVLAELRRFVDALAVFDRISVEGPRLAEIRMQQAGALYELGRLEEALAHYDSALSLAPDEPVTLHGRANALLSLSRSDEALTAYDRLLARDPGHAEGRNNRGVVLLRLKRPEEALANFDAAAGPPSAGLLNNRGNALKALQRQGEALAAFDAALALEPGFADALNNLGVTLWEMNRAEEALVHLDAALAREPRHAEALHNRGNALNTLRRLEEAAASFEAALAVKPDHRFAFGSLAGAALSLCDWPRMAAIRPEIEKGVRQASRIVPPLTMLGYSDDPALIHLCASASIAAKTRSSPPRKGPSPRRDKIRIAYLSPDFRAHPVAFQIAALLEHHDSARFELTGISFCEDDGSAVRGRIAAALGGLHDAGTMSDRAVAERIESLGIDIAIDLAGNTLGARPGIFAQRPAPVQALYLGYPGTVGADFMDYILADAIVTPFAHQPFYSERIVQLPVSFFPTEPRAISETSISRAQAGLPENGFVFCCFNNNWKLTPPVFDIWMRLLAALPQSVLWLRDDGAATRANLAREAAARGIDPARLVYAARMEQMADHLARHRLADLFLDTLPYGAHTTACDALWAGLPVLTSLGRAFPGRVAASLLTAVGMEELIAPDLAAYEAQALALARDPARLGALRGRLAAGRQSSALFDTARLCRNLESAFATMIEGARAGALPEGFSVTNV